MDFSFQIDGLDAIAGAGERVNQAVADEVSKATYASAQRIATDYKKAVQGGQKSGRIYRHGTVEHRASAPGEPPASDTGRLVNAIHVTLENAFSSVMRVASKYAMPLEVGTKTIAARPAAVPAMEQNRSWIIGRLTDAVRRGLDRAKR